MRQYLIIDLGPASAPYDYIKTGDLRNNSEAEPFK